MTHSDRPLVIVEDHIRHIDDILALLRRKAPDLLSRLTIICLDDPGPDTQKAVDRWTSANPELRVVANVVPTDPRQQALPAAALEDGDECAKELRRQLSARGVLLLDIQLKTLGFQKKEYWKTVTLASSVRGRYADRPRCLFMSNKRIFSATFGHELGDHGFSLDDVLDKDELEEVLVPLLLRSLREAFPLEIERSDRVEKQWLTADVDRQGTGLDLVLWNDKAAKVVLTGEKVVGGLVEPRADSHEALTWCELVDAHLRRSIGISSLELGERVAPGHALPAEQRAAASRLIDKMRNHLEHGEAGKDKKDNLPMLNGHYRLADELTVGRVRRRPRSPVPRG